MHVGLSLLTLFPGRVGGSETYVRGLLDQFAAGNGPERVTVLANREVMRAYDDAWRHGAVGLHHVASYRAGRGLGTRALAMGAARLAPRRAARGLPDGLDVLHHAVTVPVAGADCPSVVTVHDVSHLDERGPRSWPLRAYRHWAYDGAARAADVVIATSQFSRRRVVEGMGVDPARVEVVPMGIDHGRFRPAGDPGDDAALHGLELPERFVLYPANLWPHKNHEALLEALARVESPELALVLVGEEYGRGGRLARLAARLGVAGRVHRLGHRPPATVAGLYRRAAATVVASRHEGFGFPALEAMACGCPLAHSGRGALGELDGDCAVVFEADDPASIAGALDRVTGDDALRERLVAAGLRTAGRYSWEACARRHAEVYARAAQRDDAL